VPTKALISWGDIQIRANQWIAVLVQPGDHYELLTVDVENRRVKLIQLELEYSSRHAPYSFCTQEGGLLAIADDHVVMFSRSGEVVARVPTQRQSSIETYRLQHHRGRFFVEQTTGVWYALSLNSATAYYKWQQVFDLRRNRKVELVALFDWVGHEGPVGITRQAEIYFPEDGRLAKLSDGIQGPIEVLDVSPCGECVLIEQQHTPSRERWFVSLPSGSRQSASVSRSARQLVTARWLHPIRGHLRRHFRAVGCNSGGQLVLVSTKNQIWTIALRGLEMRLEPGGRYAASSAVKVKSFDQRVNLPDVAFHLDLATWRDGSQIYLDSRGLLHLRSSDQAIPEATLVLASGGITGWSADGMIWGNQFYAGSQTNAAFRDTSAEVIGPIVERLTW
jgi:hypothetical protein